MSDTKRKTTALIASIDPVEFGVQLFEAVVGVKRPVGLSAQQAFDLLPPDDKPRVLRAARAACEYMTDAINSGRKPS